MKASVFVVLCCVFSASLAAHTWIGEWTETKRDFGGPLYICVNLETNQAYGTYSGAGIMRGSIKNGVFTGNWYEAGYDRPYGTFSLTINTASSPMSFTGSWRYSDSSIDEDFTWTGEKINGDKPSNAQCLIPARAGTTAEGTYEHTENICLHQEDPYQNTRYGTGSASFEGFGIVEGFTPDDGFSLLLSDYYYQPSSTDDDQDSFKPEDNGATFGPCSDCNQDPTDDDIQTGRIIIGALVSDSQFCGWFWDGLYNHQYGDAVTCFSRTNVKAPSDAVCGFNAGARALQHGHTQFIISLVQSAFDALTLPDVSILLGQFSDDDDEGHYGPGFFSQFLTEGDLPDDDDDGDDDNGNVVYVPVPTPVPVPVPTPVIVYVYVDDDDTVPGDDDDNNGDDDNGDDDNADDDDNVLSSGFYDDDDFNTSLIYDDDGDLRTSYVYDDDGNPRSIFSAYVDDEGEFDDDFSLSFDNSSTANGSSVLIASAVVMVVAFIAAF